MKNEESTKKQYTVYKCRVDVKDPLFSVFDKWAHLSNNLYNDTLFVLRQLFVGLSKDRKDMSLLESTTIDSVLEVAKLYNKKLILDKDHRLVSYSFLDFYFKKTNNENYNSSLPKQTAQYAIKDAFDSFSSWFKALNSYKRNPSMFTGRPKMPKYRKSGGVYVVKLTNQDAVFYKKKFGYEVKFPKTKHRLQFNNKLKDKKLKEVNIRHEYGAYKITYLFEDLVELVENKGNVVCGIDIGVNNLVAMQTSKGDSLLVKGEFIKSKNQWYNKKIAKNLRGQTIGTNNKAISSRALNKIYESRKLFMEDVMHKVSKKIVKWCQDKDVSTIVIGSNKFWKQKISIGKANNQTFIQMPFSLLIGYIKDNAFKAGIEVVETEESYTSKVSFLDLDDIPVYDKDNQVKHKFSGKRIARGMYRSKDGLCFNADLNGAGNILRKYYKGQIDINLDSLISPEVLRAANIYK